MTDSELIEVVVTRNGVKEPPRYYPLDRLQELMDRANQAFGTPEIQLGGPETPNPEGNAYDRATQQRRLGALQPKKSRVGQGKP